MQKDEDKIIIYRNGDREVFNLVQKIEVTRYGKITFDTNDLKELKIKRGKPYQVITIEKTTLTD
jgi:hypothetical protein